jgi:hypothetical protein
LLNNRQDVAAEFPHLAVVFLDELCLPVQLIPVDGVTPCRQLNITFSRPNLLPVLP